MGSPRGNAKSSNPASRLPHKAYTKPPIHPLAAVILPQLAADFPQLKFRVGARFKWSYRQNTVFLGPPEPNYALLTLHELAHGLNKDKGFTTHVERLKIESRAWERAKTLYSRYRDMAKSQETPSLAAKSQEKLNLAAKTADFAGPAPNSQQITPEFAQLILETPWDEEFVEAQLDTYRDWLHRQSRCPACGLTRYQTPDGHYHCPYCDTVKC